MKPIQHIFIDFDSTLIQAESLDVLAEELGMGETIKEMTRQSLDGTIPFEQVFAKKMDMMAPSEAAIYALANHCVSLLTDGAKEFVDRLHHMGKTVHILSANFMSIIEPTAKYLGISQERIIANHIYFADGAYIGISKDNPLCFGGGKKIILEEKIANGYHPCAMIGDSMSDMACQGVADIFIGFGGVEERKIVQEQAMRYVTDSNVLALLPHILTVEELRELGLKK